MTKRGLGLVVLAAVVLGGVWWSRARRTAATRATSTVTQSTAAKGPAGTEAVSAPRRGATATVMVSDDKGAIADAIVRFAPDEGDVIVVKTAADGSAHADKLAPGTWRISASAAGHEPAALSDTELAAGANANLALTLIAGGRALTGTVTDATGGPIAGARIDAARLGGLVRPGRAVASALTDAGGKYQIAVSEGQLLVAVASADYASQSRYLLVGASGAVADFSLVPGGVIEGIVRDDKTRLPVVGASVEARRDRGNSIMLAEGGGHHAVAGADGRFRISGLRPGVYELRAHGESRDSKTATVVGLGVAEQVTDVELSIGAGAVVRGLVVDDQGAPIGNIEVTAMGRGPGAEAKAGPTGAFVLEGLPPGSYQLTARGDELVPAGATPIDVGDKDLEGVKVTVRRGYKLAGHVEPRQLCDIHFDLDDRTLGSSMPIMFSGTATDARGEFSLGAASPGKVRLTARCASGDQGMASIEVAPGVSNVVIKVAPGASVAGRVIDGEGQPIVGASVMAASQGPSEHTMIVNGMVTSGAQAVTGGDGSYVVRSLGPGDYRLSVLDRGRPLRTRGKPVAVTLGATEARTGVELAVDRPNGVIKGTVTGPDGKPLADAWVTVQQDVGSMIEGMARDAPTSGSHMISVETRDEDSGEGRGGGASEFPPALTDARGAFQIVALPHASYDVVAEAQAGKLRGRATAVTPDATLSIQVAGVTSLSGTVKTAAGPVAQFTVELRGPTPGTRTFTGGTFQFARVAPGDYTIRVTSREGNTEAKTTVIVNQPASVDLTLAANAVVIGKVVDGDGKPVAGVGVLTLPDDGGHGVSVRLDALPPSTGPDGSFRVEAKAGPTVLVLMTQPRPITRRGIVTEPGKTLDVGAIRSDAQPPPRP